MKTFQNAAAAQCLASSTQTAATDRKEKELDHLLAPASLSFPWHHPPEAGGWPQGHFNGSLVTDWMRWNALT